MNLTTVARWTTTLPPGTPIEVVVTPHTVDDVELPKYYATNPVVTGEVVSRGVYMAEATLQENVPEGTWDTLEVRSDPLNTARGNATCVSERTGVFRTANCPLVGWVGLGVGNCSRCGIAENRLEPDWAMLHCPGGNRLLPLKGECLVDRQTRIARCSPELACDPEEYTCTIMDDCPEDFDSGLAVTCGVGYAPADAEDPCCGACAPGYRRLENVCISRRDWGGTSAWEASSLTLTLLGLVVLGWVCRRETQAVVPFLFQLFRLSQAISLTAMNLTGYCTSLPPAFSVMIAVFPVLTGLADYFHVSDGPIARFFEQLTFALLYLLALMATPAMLFVRARLGARRGQNDPDEIAVPLSAKRSFTLFFFLMFGTLGYIATGQWVCHLNRADLRNGHPTADKVISNYHISPCGPKVMPYVVTCALGLALLVGLVVLALSYIRKVFKLASRSDAELADYQGLAFLYAHCKPHRTRWWLADFVPVLCAMFIRSFVTLEDGAFGPETTRGAAINALFIVVLLAALASVAIVRPFVHWTSNLAYCTGCLSMVCAVALRVALAQCSVSESAVENGLAQKLEGKSKNALSVMVLAFFLVTVLLNCYGAFLSRKKTGQIRYFAGYTGALMESTGPVSAAPGEEEMQAIGTSRVGDL